MGSHRTETMTLDEGDEAGAFVYNGEKGCDVPRNVRCLYNCQGD